jgi:hypothetical protein
MTDHWQFWLLCAIAGSGGLLVVFLGGRAWWRSLKGKDDLDQNGPD